MLISRTQLPGGARVVTEHMPGVRAAAVGFWLGVGSRDEAAEVQGSSHFLEHLLFKGNDRQSARDIAEAFDAIGGEANAFSSKEYTCVYARVLDEDVEMAVRTVADMVRRPAVRSEDVENERNVILEEIAMHEDTPEDLVHDLFAEAVFGDHPLSREVMGTISSVGSITRESLFSFHETNYQPKNLVAAAAGNIDHDRVSSLVLDYFPEDGRIPAPRELVTPVPGMARRVVTRKTEQAHVVLGGLGYSRSHPDRFAWGVLDSLLGSGMSSRLFQEIRETRGLAYSIYSYRNLFSETGSYGVYAGAGPSNVGEVLRLIGAEFDRLVEEGISESELERAKGHLRGGMVLGLEDTSARMSRLGRSELVHGEILSVDELIARVDEVTVDDVNRVARELLDSKRRVLAAIGPFEESDLEGAL